MNIMSAWNLKPHANILSQAAPRYLALLRCPIVNDCKLESVLRDHLSKVKEHQFYETFTAK